MKIFGSKKANTRYGAIIEIGSGSVITAIVISNDEKNHPDIIWSEREYATITLDQDTDRSLKSMLTTLMNSVMNLDQAGRAALKATYPHAEIEYLQISISAPWAYTISKIIRYEHDEPFTVTEDLIHGLTVTADQKTTDVLTESEKTHDSGITIMTRATTDITANDYRTMTPINQKACSVSLTQVSAVGQNLITGAISDLKDKLFPKVKTERYSTMLIFHCIIRDLYPTMTEYCLIDLTYEATEIAIIRDGVLQYSTHTPIGLNTLVRNLAARLKVPEGDARTMLKQIYQTDNGGTDLTDKQKVVFDELMTEYRGNLEALFHETGDSLSIPKVMFLHGNYQHENFFDDHMLAAARAATGSTHTIHTVSHDLLTSMYDETERKEILIGSTDSAILMSAQFFHKQHHCNDFVQL